MVGAHRCLQGIVLVAARGDTRHHDSGDAPGTCRTRPRLWLRHDPTLLQAPPDNAQEKIAHASEQNRQDILKRRREWFDDQIDLDPARLVFIDETWAKTNMARASCRAPRGERLRAGVPHGHWKTTAFVGGLTLRGMIAPFVLNGPINRIAFEAYVEQVLVPELRPGDIVIMDNLSSHKGLRPHR